MCLRVASPPSCAAASPLAAMTCPRAFCSCSAASLCSPCSMPTPPPPHLCSCISLGSREMPQALQQLLSSCSAASLCLPLFNATPQSLPPTPVQLHPPWPPPNGPGPSAAAQQLPYASPPAEGHPHMSSPSQLWGKPLHRLRGEVWQGRVPGWLWGLGLRV